jgi:hypothetical protein
VEGEVEKEKLPDDCITASEACFKVPGQPAPKRKKDKAAQARGAKKSRIELDKDFEAFLKKGWQYWWTFDSPDEEEQFQQRLAEANRQFLADWTLESQPLDRHFAEVEKRVYEEVVANRIA